MKQRRRALFVMVGAMAVGGVLAAQWSRLDGRVHAATGSAGEAGVVPLSRVLPLKVERFDPALNALVPAKATIERVATGPGFKWTEGPVWISAGGYLLFAEIPSNSIRKWTPGKGVSVFLQPSGYKEATPYTGPEPGSNGMTLDPRGRLTVAGHAQRDVWRLETIDPHAQVTVLADTYQGKRLNSPNDLVYKSDGTLYFTDPPYGLPKLEGDPAKQMNFNGVFRLPGAAAQAPGAPPNREQLQLLVTQMTRPNGICFSPDEKYLYINNSEPKKYWMRYTVKPDGGLTDGQVFWDATSDPRVGSPDGMKVDSLGNIYSAGPGGVWIFSPEGKHLGTLDIPERVGNVAWGGPDYKTLYVAASSSIYRVPLSVSGDRSHLH